ncbi:MAG: NAD-dependent epimerase/dehydratase family protein [Polyangiaceae bacterium]
MGGANGAQQHGGNGRLFLTGGSGYVGRNLIRHFVERGVAVRALVRSDSSAKVVQELGAEPFRGDMVESDLGPAMQGIEWMIHAAADTNHGESTREQERVNLQGTRNVFRSAREAGVKRGLHISTESVLLDGSPLVNADESTPFPAHPAGGYSRTKAEAERIALAQGVGGLQVVVLRPRFVWGRDDTTALPQLIEAANTGKLVWIDGGHYLTSTTHVGNLCRAAELALERGGAGEVYFVTDGEPVVFREFVSSLLESQGVAPPGKSVPRWLVNSLSRVAEFASMLNMVRLKSPISRQEYATLAVEVTLNIDKARRELGYTPVVSLEEGLAELRARR